MKKEQFDFIHRIRMHWLLRNIVFGKDVLDFIACQFALESNFGTSRLASINHNYCGMKIPSRRVTYRDGQDGVFSTYACLDDCVKDYVSWLLYNRPNQMQLTYLDSFMIFLRDSGYCPETGYVDRINKVYNDLKTYQNEFKKC